MRRIRAAAIPLAALAGCAAPSVPEGYDGPRAIIADSTQQRAWIGVDYFMLRAIDDRQIRDSMDSSIGYGSRPIVSSAAIRREVPSQPASFTIAGVTRYATALEELRNPAYSIIGMVQFTPEPDGQYVVRGELGEGRQAVWIEDVRTGAVMDRKIEKTGPATAGAISQ
jgi:hypothetical protein